jgi:SpoVK/Ycf46/Vps4 family AAA+-type ATPase
MPFSANIEELLERTPKKYDVTPSANGIPVKITEVSELLPSRPFRHLIASKALTQWEQADTPEDKTAWARQIKDWFSETPEKLEKQYSSQKSLYDLFMDSEQNKGLGSLAGMQDLKNYFLTNVISPLFDSENIQGYKGLILHGEPGNGKTALATALARHTGFNLYHIRRGDLETTYKNGVAETIAKTLKHAKDNKPSIVILEEVDSIAASRDNTQSIDGSEAKETTAIMNGIDQLIEDNPPVILLATTNFIDKLDKAFRREGRFHDEIEIHNPDQELREHLFRTYLKKFNNSEALARKAAKISDGLTTAAIRTICEYDIANDSKIQSRFRKVSSESTSKDLEFDKLKECIERRKKSK